MKLDKRPTKNERQALDDGKPVRKLRHHKKVRLARCYCGVLLAAAMIDGRPLSEFVGNDMLRDKDNVVRNLLTN